MIERNMTELSGDEVQQVSGAIWVPYTGDPESLKAALPDLYQLLFGDFDGDRFSPF
jgi:hypothetical protein